MKHYKVFKHPSGLTEAVKQGWSWPAFFFGALWALVKGMWGVAVGVFVASLALGLFLGSLGGNEGDGLVNILSIIINLIFGASGNSWLESKLVSRGYKQVDTVTASNSEGAVAAYLNNKSQPVSEFGIPQSIEG